MNVALRRASVNGTALTYVAHGEGEPVLFVHGSVSDHRCWGNHLHIMSKGYRCIALDQRYFGQSRPTAGAAFGISTHADDLRQFIESVAGGPVHAVAASYGAAVVLATAANDPSSFKSVFLHEPFLPSVVTEAEDRAVLAQVRGELAGVAAALAENDLAKAVECFVDWVGSKGGFALLPAHIRAMALDNARTVALQLSASPPKVKPEELGALTMPIEITVGERTNRLFRVQSMAVHRCMPHSRLTWLAGGGHNVYLEDPAQFTAALLRHLCAHGAA